MDNYIHNINRTTPKNIIIASILLALFVDIKIINLILVISRPSLEGVLMAFLYGTVGIGLFYVGLVKQRNSLLGLSPSHIWIFGVCVLWYILTVSFVGQPSVPLPFFMIFTLVFLLIPGIITIDVRIFLLALLMLPFVGVFYLDQIFFNEIAEGGNVSMGTCYALLVPVLANLVHLRFYYSKEKRWFKILLLPFYAINIFYLIQMTLYGSRGPFLCALLLIISFFLIKTDQNGKITIRKKRIPIILLLFVSLLFFFDQILQGVSVFFSRFNISLNVIDKFLMMEELGDMSNGRSGISSIAWDSITSKPLLGYGTAQFENNTGIIYPHNFLLQFLYDGGVCLTCFVLIPLIRSISVKLHHIDTEESICLLLLFFSSVPGALFSGDLWESCNLWLFFGFALSKCPFYKRTILI